MRRLYRMGSILVLGSLLLGAAWLVSTSCCPASRAHGGSRSIQLNTPSPSPSATTTPTATPTKMLIKCTPPACGSDEILHCPSHCPGGCGYVCITVTPRAPTPIPRRPAEIIRPANAHLLEPLVLIFPDARLLDLAFLGNGEIATVGFVDRISRWDVTTGRETARIVDESETAKARCITANADGTLVATCGAQGNGVRLWEIATGTMREIGHYGAVGVAFNPSNALLATGDGEDMVQIWEVDTGRPRIILKGDVPHSIQYFDALYWRDDETLIAAGHKAIYWWNVSTGELKKRLDGPHTVPFFVDVAFGQNGRRLAVAAQDNAVYIWDGAGDTWERWMVPGSHHLSQVNFSPDGRLLAAASLEGGLLVWDMASQEMLAQRSQPAASIADLEFSPDGRYVAAIGWDSTIWLWGIAENTPPTVPEGPTWLLLGLGVVILSAYAGVRSWIRERAEL